MKYALALALLAGLPAAHAVTTTYTQSSLFFSALAGPSQTETYEGYGANLNVTNGFSLGGYTYSNFPVYNDGPEPGAETGRIDLLSDVNAGPTDFSGFYSVAGGTKSLAAWFTPTVGTANKDYFFQGESFDISLPANTYAIGLFFNISTANTPNANDLFVNTSAGTAANGLANYDLSQGNNDGTNGGLGTKNLFFVGLISDTPFTSATIGVNTAGNTGWNIDNLTTATPEPTSVLLLTFGAASLLGYSRRRSVR